MPKRKFSFSVGEFYHIYNRGNSKQKIFIDSEDYYRFLKFVYLSNSKKSINFRDDIVTPNIEAFDFDRGETLVDIGAWVLMPNHFHIYVTPTPTVNSPRRGLGGGEDLAVPIFMQKLCTAYSMYFNKKYKRTGKLFEGAFKSVEIKGDEKAKYLFSYIHLKTVKLIEQQWKTKPLHNIKKVIDFLNNYKYSSYLDHKGIARKENKIIFLKNFPRYFKNIKELDKEIFDWLTYSQI